MGGVVDGQSVDETVTNSAFIFKSGTDTFVSDLEAASVTPASGGSIDNIQQEHNSIASFVGKTTNTAKDAVPTYTNDQGFTPNSPIRTRVDNVSAKFHNTTGHTHDGTAGQGGPIPLPVYYQQAPTGTVDGVNADFVLPATPTVPLSLQFCFDGRVLRYGIDYTLSGDTITLTNPSQDAPTGALPWAIFF